MGWELIGAIAIVVIVGSVEALRFAFRRGKASVVAQQPSSVSDDLIQELFGEMESKREVVVVSESETPSADIPLAVSPTPLDVKATQVTAMPTEPAERDIRFDHISPLYLEALTLVERLHCRLLDVIKDEFDRRGRADINSVQALLLYNIGDKEMTAGELRTRGYYLGSNVSYNLKKLVEMNFLDHRRSRVDRSSVRIKLTQKGQGVRDIVESLYQKHIRTVEQVGGINADEFSTLNKSLHRLERFWTDQILYRL
jgi:DNA-binding MarR family transcriptional regulator